MQYEHKGNTLIDTLLVLIDTLIDTLLVPELYTSVFVEMLETQFSNNRNAQKAIFDFSKMLKKQFSNFRLGMYDMRFRLGI